MCICRPSVPPSVPPSLSLSVGRGGVLTDQLVGLVHALEQIQRVQSRLTTHHTHTHTHSQRRESGKTTRVSPPCS